MTPKGYQTARPLPTGLKRLASAIIGFHLLALGVAALAAPSGPWPTPVGKSSGLPPRFASMLNEVTTPFYLQPLSLANDYHFPSNQLTYSTVHLEVRITNKDGKSETLTYPDENASEQVRSQQVALVQMLGQDQPFQPNPEPGVMIFPPGTKVPQVTFWMPTQDPRTLDLTHVDVQLMRIVGPPFMTYQTPNEESLILAQSFHAYFKRKYPDAAKIELVRRNREPVIAMLMLPHPRMPGRLILDDAPPNMHFWDTLTCNLGDGKPKAWQPKFNEEQ